MSENKSTHNQEVLQMIKEDLSEALPTMKHPVTEIEVTNAMENKDFIDIASKNKEFILQSHPNNERVGFVSDNNGCFKFYIHILDIGKLFDNITDDGFYYQYYVDPVEIGIKNPGGLDYLNFKAGFPQNTTICYTKSNG